MLSMVDHWGGPLAPVKSAETVFRASKGTRRVWNRRRWLRGLRIRALRRAFALLHHDPDVNGVTLQAAEEFATALDATPLPGEPSYKVMQKVGRWLRDTLAWGIRFPDWRAGEGKDFLLRLYQWALAAAETEAGRRALRLCELDPNDDRIVDLFARTFAHEVHGQLLSQCEHRGEEFHRQAMARTLFAPDRLTEHRRIYRNVGTVLTGLAAGAVSYEVIEQATALDWFAIYFGSFTAAAVYSAGVRLVRRHPVGPGFSSHQKAIRRRVNAWLGSISFNVSRPDVSTEDSVSTRSRRKSKRRQPTELRHTKARDMTHASRESGDCYCLSVGLPSESAGYKLQDILTILRNIPLCTERPSVSSKVLEELASLREQARTVGDEELELLLHDMETGLMYEPSQFVRFMTSLIVATQSAADTV